MIFGKFFEKIKKGLKKTKDKLLRAFGFGKLDAEKIEEIEEALIGADVGVDATMKIVEKLNDAYRKKEIETGEQTLEFLKKDLRERMVQHGTDLIHAAEPPTVILVAGVNGTGKTTSIAKLAKLFTGEGKRVILCASDTFRAAAVEQLTIWSERLGVDIVKHQMGADPAAVVFDGVEAARARNADYLIIDTAGRLQTKENLMKELTKIRDVAQRKIPDAPHEVLLVLDATTGQNAISQAQHFKQAINVTGLFLSKLDGTAKGGVVVAIKDALVIPVKFIGTGETPDDIARFDAAEFVEALFS